LDLKDPATKRKLVAFGYLLGLVMCNQEKITFKLHLALVHMCLNNTSPLKDLSYLAFQIMEDPQFGTTVANWLRDPESIEPSGMNFSDMDKPDRDVKKTNILEYLRVWVEKMYIPEGSKWVAYGFQKYWSEPITCKVTTFDVYNSLFAPVLDQDTIDKFIKRITFGSPFPKKVKTWLLEIIKEAGEDFFKKLLHFWSSQFTVSTSDTAYQVVIGDHVITDTVCPLPHSHTCFYQLVLPKKIPSKEKLREILEMAVGYAQEQQGVQMFGGKKVSNRVKRG
jgi:hypothetical protein